MDTVIEYFAEHTFLDLMSALVVIVAVVVCIEKFFKWAWSMFVKAYNKMKGREEEVSTIDKNTAAIEALSVRIEELGNLVNKQYTHLDKKIDEQKDRLATLDSEGKKRDCALLRDRIIGGLRYFGQNKDEQGRVHISMTDHENMSHLFEEYFGCNGNGTVKTMHDNEFETWIIDN